jgi:hypothetical protein
MATSLQKNYEALITSGAQVGLLYFGAETESRAGWVICLALIATVSLFAWSSAWRRRRAITDTPTSRIASAAQGYVELSGTGRQLDSPPLFSRLTNLPCLWDRWEVKERRGKHWTMIDSGESDIPFLIDDGSGRCVVDVEGAHILTKHKRTWMKGKRRYSEWTLLDNDRIYALGEFKTLGGGSVDLDAGQDLKELLAEWKKDQRTLLKHFDLDGDGTLNEKEWGLARQAARREVSKIHREARNEPDVHTLRCPQNSHRYLLSNIDPNRLARRYLGWSIFHMVAFLSSLGAIPWVLHHFQ